MPTTAKRIHVALTESDLRDLEELKKHFGETTSQIVKRAIILLHYITFKQEKK